MDQQTLIQNFLSNQNIQIPILNFLVNLILAAILGYILSLIYTKYGKSLSNRQTFARNFVLLAVTTTLIITVVKSSLALSLGLVGALSIVRLRAAIKEPEELAYLFLTIGIGLGLGADQLKITLVAFVLITVVILILNFKRESSENQNLNLVISTNKSEKIDLSKIIAVLKQSSSKVDLRRFDESTDGLKAVFNLEIENLGQLEKAKSSLRQLDKNISISFLDNKGIF